MVSVPTVITCALVFVILGWGWIKGYDIVRQKSPQMLVRFYLVYAVFRMLTILLLAGLYILLISTSVRESKAFVAMLFAMYALMMAVTLKMRH